MKGISFQKPLELQLEVQGNSWTQGEPITGTLTATNRGSEPVSLAPLQLLLADGTLRKVHEKKAGAYEILARAELAGGSLEPGKSASFPWTFTTDRNALITDVSYSLFLLFGTAATPENLAPLQLDFRPYPLITEILDIFRTHFRFALKSCKNGKYGVEAKFSPPAGKGFTSLEYLSVSFRFDGETVALRYLFNVKKIDASAANALEVSKQKHEFKQTLGPSQYRVSSGRTHHESIESAIRDVLSQFEGKPSA